MGPYTLRVCWLTRSLATQEEEKRGGKKGRLLGIITLSDVLRYIIGEATIGEVTEQRSGRASVSERRPSQESARPISVASENPPLPEDQPPPAELAPPAAEETPAPKQAEEQPSEATGAPHTAPPEPANPTES